MGTDRGDTVPVTKGHVGYDPIHMKRAEWANPQAKRDHGAGEGGGSELTGVAPGVWKC